MTVYIHNRGILVVLASPRFITAASDGDLEAVQTYLKEGLDVNSQDWDKLTALVAAASQGHLEVVKVLLDKVSLPAAYRT